MATGDTVPPPLSIPPPPIEPLSDDDNSSPLSDVEDKDDGLDHDGHNIVLDRDNEDAEEEVSDDDLSDANDTEAETERLYDTPQKPTRQITDNEALEPSPSKLRQHAIANDDHDDDDEPLSEPDEDISMASSPPTQQNEAPQKRQSPTLDLLAEIANQEAENRKRKRSSIPTEQPDPGQPLRKRTGSVVAGQPEDADGDTAMVDEDEPSTNTNSGEHSADEGINTAAIEEDAEDPPEETKAVEGVDSKPKKHTRNGSRRRKASEDSPAQEETVGEDIVLPTAEEEQAQTGDDEQPEADVDEAEAAHRDEEELERKRQAFEQLKGIEKKFATFRDRLYDERLEKLNQEEAMLRSDKPTHPEYLAMMQCVDERRDGRLRIANRELEYNMENLDRWAVARRAQVHSQFFQGIREAREALLEELGRQWYDIQHERRKQANSIPDYGIRYPQSQSQRLRNALAYNKEVSILAGVAKYEGMPAAPNMKGATASEIEEDFEAINRSRRPAPRNAQVPRAFSAVEYGLPFGQGLGPAGEQFLEQTPWANPNHPSHGNLISRQVSSQNETPNRQSSPAPRSSGNRRHSHNPNNASSNNVFSSSTISNSSAHNAGAALASLNGNGGPMNFGTPTATGKTTKDRSLTMAESPEMTRAATLLEQSSSRAMKAAETAVKHEAVAPLGGF